jgi:alkylation response protein AidB-like acyl-CoA dehydrogenase
MRAASKEVSMTLPVGCAFLIESIPEDIFVPEDFTEEQRAMATTAAEFVEREVVPKLDEIEAQQPGVLVDLLKRAGELGLLAVEVPEAYGGLGLDKATAMLVAERAADVASFSISWGAHTGIGSLPIVYFGTEAQREHYLPRLASGEWLAAYALTEADSGSDALAAKTVARRDGDDWVLSGTKQFITNAGFADVFIVFAQADGDKFTGFIVERGDPGVSTGPEEQKLGLKGSSTRQLILDDTRIPGDRLLGDLGRGHKIAFNILNIGRFKLGCGAVGTSRECLRYSIEYARERRQFGQPIIEFGMIQRKIADMATRLYAAESVGYRTAGLLDAGIAAIEGTGDARDEAVRAVLEEYTVECSIVKVFGSECLDFVADEAMQILGGYGFLKDYPIERHYRDSRINRIFEGTNEINRLIIPATVMKRAGQGRLDYFGYVGRVKESLGAPPEIDATEGPLAEDVAAVEQAKRIVAWTTDLLVQRNLKDLANQQQHLEILANMVIDVFAGASVVARTRKLLRAEGAEAVANELDLTRIFVASANERIADGARRLIANELAGDELREAFAIVDGLAVFLPIATIATKTRLAERIAEGNVRFLTE